jgi:hypothetical protein
MYEEYDKEAAEILLRIENILDEFTLSSKERFEKLIWSLNVRSRIFIADYLQERFNEMQKETREWLLITLSKDSSRSVTQCVIDVIESRFPDMSGDIRDQMIKFYAKKSDYYDIKPRIISLVDKHFKELSRNVSEKIILDFLKDEDDYVKLLDRRAIISNYEDLSSDTRKLIPFRRIMDELIELLRKEEASNLVKMEKCYFEEMLTLHEFLPGPELHPINKIEDKISSIQKFADITFPSRIELNKRYGLTVRLLTEITDENAKDMVLLFGYEEEIEEIEITVALDATDFEIEESEQKMKVPLTEGSSPLVFYLIPRSVGRKKLFLKFYQNESYNGEIIVRTTVLDPTNKKDSRRAPFRGNVGINLSREEKEDLCIEVGTNNGHLEYIVTSRILRLFRKKYRSGESLNNPRHFMNIILERLSAMSSVTFDDEKQYERIFSQIETIGMDIYKKLIPDEFKRALWDKKDEIKNIFVVSDEEWIPWEIIKPFRISESGDTEVDEFWCLKYAISRWLPCYFPEKRIFVGKSALIAYDNNGKLKHVPAEVKIITEILRSEGVDVMSIEPKRFEVLKQLNDSEMNLIHFACESTHNERSPDDSDIKLEDDGLKARDIGVTNLRKGRPLVCISACESGRTGYTFSGIGGFAKAFLDVGSQAFIGPMWRVPDRLSAKFSEELYRNIFEDGLSVGEALKTARHKLMTIKNPAWMSYLLYSSPVLRIAKKKEVLT